MSDITQYLSLSDLFYLAEYLPSPSRLLQMAKLHPFLWLSSIHLFVSIPLVDGHLGCFQILAVLNSASLKIAVHVYFPISALGFSFFGYITRRGISGLYDISIFSFFEKSPYVQTTLFKVAFQHSLIPFPLHFLLFTPLDNCDNILFKYFISPYLECKHQKSRHYCLFFHCCIYKAQIVPSTK